MALDDSEKRVERPREGGQTAPESALEEANAGRQDLIREQRAQTEYLRSGGRSGITSEFGRIVLTGLDAMRDGLRRLAGGEPGQPGDQGAEPSGTGQAGRSVGDVRQMATGATERDSAGRVIQELPSDAHSSSRGLGRMVMDGLQAISRGFRAGEPRPRSARAELGEEAPGQTGGAEGRTIEEVPRDTRAGSVSGRPARMLVDRIQGAFERGGPERGTEAGSPVSEVRTDIAEPGSPHMQLDSRPSDFVPITSPEADPLVRQWQRPPIELPPEGTSADAPRAPEAPERPPEGREERSERGREHAGEGEARFRAHPNFRGEVIHLDVEPATHTYHRGERLRDIAAQHLGPGPHDPEDVRRHVREIERVNHLRHGQAIPEGRRLILPGHTADGGYVMLGDGSERRTTWADGVQRVERPDHTGYVRRPTDDHGGYTEHRWGPRSEDNLDFTRTADGRFQIGGRDVDPGDRRIGRALWENQDELNAEGRAYASLSDRIQSLEDRLSRQHGANAFDTPEMRRLEHLRIQMQEFEERARREGVPPQEVARTFQEVERLLESDATSPTDAGQRLVLADQIMEHAAHPDSIDQGEHNTCNVSSIETRMYARTPSAAAHLVAEVATTGHFTERGADGRQIDIDPASLRPDGEARAERDGRATYETPDGSRDYASQIFQVTAVNVHYAHHDLVWDHPDGRHEVLARAGEVVYRQGTSEAPHDTGERLVRRDTGQPVREPGTPPGAEIREPFLRASDLSDINRRISGSSESDVVFSNAQDGLPDTTHFGNEAELEQHVARLRDEGRLPAVIRVHTGVEPFFSDSGGGSAGGSGGWHDVTITGYDPATHRIAIDNQWGSEHDRGGERSLSPHDLYLATLRPGSPEILAELRAREARTHSFDDRMELLRQEREATPPLPRGELNRRMAEALNESNREHPDRPVPGVLAMQRDEVQVQRELRFVHALYGLSDSDRRDVLRRLDDGLRQRIERGLATYDRAMTRVARSGERDGAAVQAGDLAWQAQTERPATDLQAGSVGEPSAEDAARRAAAEQMAADRVRTGRPGRSSDSREESGHDGRRERSADRSEEVAARIDNPEVNAARDRLMQDAEQRIGNPAERRQFRADMEAFERRAQESHMAPQEVARTYEQISRLLEATGDGYTSASDRVVLAEQVMHQAAHPTAIDQGQHGTCTVASAESRIYTREPSEAVRLVADVATTGSYRTTDGRTTVTLDPGSIHADAESDRSRPRGAAECSGDRSYASQLFEVTAVNIGHARRDYNIIDREGHILRTIPAGQVHYEQHVPEAGTRPPDTGERLMDYSRTPPEEIPNLYGNPLRGTGLSNDQIVDINNAITGTNDAVVIERAGLGAGDHTTTVSSPEQLQQTIERLQREGRLPAQIHVHTGNEPFLHDSGGGRAGGSGGWHMVTITGYDAGDPNAHPPRAPRVMLDNQWGEDVDHTYPGSGISVGDLYLATRPPGEQDTIDRLQRDVSWNREHDSVDGFTEFELLRQRHIAGQLNNQQYDEALVSTTVAQAQRWRQERAGGTFDEAERDRAIQHLNEMLAAIRSSDREHGEERADRIVSRIREGTAAQAAGETHARSGADTDGRRGTPAAAPDAAVVQQQQQAALARGSERTVEFLLAATEATGGDRGYRGDRTGRREGSQTYRSRREAASEIATPDAVHGRPTEHGADTATDTPVAGYHGEVIRRDVEPARHTMLADETVEDIARAHLGTGATDEQVAAHVREINEINGGFVMEGQELVVLGHTADGGFVTSGAEGSRQTSWADGVVRINNAGGTGWVRRFFADGGMTEHHWGPTAGDNFDLTRTPDGRYRVAEAGHEAQDIAHPETDACVQRAHLEELLDSRCGGPNDRTARIRDDMREFERRAGEQHLPNEEIARTYAEVSRLLEHAGDRPLDAAQRLRVAEQILHQAAHPQTIDQGNHSTCGAAASESRMYTRHPSDAARLVVDVATTGHFTTRETSPRTVTVDPRNLQPGREEQVHPTRDGERSQASQIFQSTFVTLALDSRTTPPGQLRYEQRDPHAPPPDDTGEWIVDSSTTPPREARYDGLLISDLPRTEELITGRHEAPHVFERAGDGPATVHFNNEAELRARLSEAQTRGQMPVVIWVDSMNEPFRTDSGGGSAGGSGEGHFVTITFYDAEHNMVSIDNQWGDEHDHMLRTEGGRTVDRRMSMSDLFAATAPHDLPERIADAEAAHRQINQDRERGIYDGRTEVAALLMDRLALRVTPEEFDRRLVDLARASRQRWARSGEASPGERERTEEAYRRVIAHIRQQDPARAAALETSMAAAEA